jgi:pimeloyl-ACP methyl ester carboxylesterase
MADVPSDPSPRKVSTKHGVATITDEGQGPVVVGIHGAPGAGRDFRWLAGPIAANHRLIRVDLPGFGATPAAVCAPTRDGFSSFIIDLLDALGVDSATLLAHSFGGPIGMAVASNAPARVSGLALLAPAGLRPHRPVRRMPAPHMLARGMQTPMLRRVLRPLGRRLFGAMGFPRITEDEVVRVLEMVGGWDWAATMAASADIQAPTFLAACDDDQLVESDVTDQLSAALPAGPRLRLPTGGHALLKRRRHEILAQLVPWLSGLD